jgi:hypothetical protein
MHREIPRCAFRRLNSGLGKGPEVSGMLLRDIDGLVFLKRRCLCQAVAFPSLAFAQINPFQQQTQFPGGDFLSSSF